MADDAWYYARGGHQLGPVTIERLRAMLAAGEVARADLVWTDGMADWLPAGDLARLETRPGAVAQPAVAPAAADQAAADRAAVDVPFVGEVMLAPDAAGAVPPVAPAGGPPPVTSPMGYYNPAAGYNPLPQSAAITSLVCGIGAFVLCAVPYIQMLSWGSAIAAIIFGFIARSRVARGTETGGGMALAGIILGVVHLLLTLVGIAVIVAIAVAASRRG